MNAFLSRKLQGRAIALAALFVLYGSGAASAQTDYYWNAPMGGDGVWNTSSAMWSTSPNGPTGYTWVGTGTPNTTERANFLGYSGTVSVGGNFSAQGLVFGQVIGDTGYTLNATAPQTLSLGAGGITMGAGAFATTVGDATNLSIALGAAQTFSNASGATLNIAGNITNGANLLTLVASGGGAINITGNIGSGSGGVTVNSTGGGIVTLSGTNTYTGNTTLTAGTLRVTNAGAVGTGASALALNGGTLMLANDAGTNFARNATVGGNVTILADRSAAGAGVTHTLGTLSIGAFTLTVNSGNFVTSGSAGLTFGNATLTGNATINVNNSFTASGVTNTLTLAGISRTTQNLTIGGTGNTIITGGDFGTTTGAITKNGQGTLTLGATASSYTGSGAITINGGRINVGSGTTFTNATKPALTFGSANNGGGVFNFNAAAIGANQSFGALSFIGGDGFVLSTYGGSGTASLTFGSLAARTAGATGLFAIGNGVNGNTNKIVLTGVTPGANGIVLGSGAAGTGGGGTYFFSSLSGAASDYAVYDTGNFVRAIDYTTDTTLGTTVAASGALTASLINQITGTSGTAGTVTQGASVSVNGIKFAADTTNLSIGSSFTVTTPSILVSGGAVNATVSGAGTITAGTADLIIRTDASNNSLTLNSIVGGSGGITKTGAGTLTIGGGVNTFTGNIFVNGGVFAFNTSYNNIDTNTSLGAAGARSIILNGGTFKNSSGATFNPQGSTKALVIGAAGGTWDINGQQFQLDDASQLSGSGNLFITNTSATAAVVLLGATANGYTGFTGNIFVAPTSGAVTLRLVNANAAGNAGQTIVLTNNTTALDLQATIVNNVVVGGTGISAGGAITSSATGGGISGTVTLTANTLVNNANGVTLSGTVTDGLGGYLLTKTGAGNLALTGSNNYSGGTAVLAGTLLIGNNSALGAGALTVNGGSVAASGAANFTLVNAVTLSQNATFGQVGTNTGALRLGSLNLGGGSPRVITVNNPVGNAITFAGTVSNGTGLTLAGTGTLALQGVGAASFNGPILVNAGGTLSVGYNTLSNVSSITIGTSVTSGLNFLADGIGQAATLASGTSVLLAGSASQALLGFQLGAVGSTTSDSLNLTGAGNVTVGSSGAIIGISTLGGFGAGTYNLITTAGGTISGFSNIILNSATLPTGYTYSFSTTATNVSLTVTAATGANFYWTGGINSSWAGNSGGNFNWSTDAAGTVNAAATPGVGQTVNFSASTALAASTTLDQNYSVAGIVVSTGTPPVSISQGTFGTLTIGSGGITVGAATPPTTAINAPIVLGANQTWTVTDAASTLAVNAGAPANGAVSGSFGITLAGAGKVTLGGFNTFTGGVNTTGFTGTLNINNGGSTTTNSAVGTGVLTLASGVTIDNASGVAQYLLTNNAQSWTGDLTFAGTNSLHLGTGAVTPTTNVNRQITVTAGTLQVGGIVAGGTMRLTKAGAGTLALSGANTFTGGVTLNAGTLYVGNAAALGTAAGTFIINGGTIDNVTGAGITTNAYPMTWAGNFAFGGSAALNLGAGATAITTSDRTVTVNGPGLGVANTLTVGGIVSGAFSLTKDGAGTLSLTGANTFGGAGKTLTLNAGTLSFANTTATGNASNTLIINGSVSGLSVALDSTAATGPSIANITVNSDFAYLGTGAGLNFTAAAVNLGGATRTITVNSAANILSFGGVISNGGLTANGIGNIALYGASTFTGNTTINAGSTIQLGSNNGTANANGSLASTSTLVLNGGRLAYVRTGTASQTLAGVTIGSGAGSITTSTATQTLTLNALTRSTGGTLDINFFTGSVVNTTTTNTNGIIGGWATVTGGANWASGGGTIAAYAAYTTANAGTTTPGVTTNNYDITASNTNTWDSSTVNSLRFNTAAAVVLTNTAANTLTVSSGGILVTPTVAANTVTIAGGSIATTGDLIVNQFSTTGTVTINSAITAAGLTKSGGSTGALIIGGAGGNLAGTISNTFTDVITVNAGVLQVNSSSATGGNGATGALNSQGIVLNGGTLNLRFDDTVSNSALGNIAVSSSVTVNGSATISVDRLAAGTPIGSTTLFTSPLNKTIQLTTLSFGSPGRTLTVNGGTNGYGLEFTGTTTLNQSLTTINVSSGATASNVIPALTLSGQVTGTVAGGVWSKSGTGTLVLSNSTNDFVSNISVANGVLAFNGDSALGNASNTVTLLGAAANSGLRAYGGAAGSPLTITTSRTINLWGTAAANNVIEVTTDTTLQLNAAFGANNGSLTKANNGTLVLNANNGLWTGQLSISAGAVKVTNAGALGVSTSATAGNTVVAATGGALQLSGVSIVDQLTLTGTGISTGGALQAVDNATSTTNGLITLSGATTIGADAGSTLNIRGGITGGQTLTFAGAGNINVDTFGLGTVTGITKINSGTTTIAVGTPALVGAIAVNNGTLTFRGSNVTVGGAGAISVNWGATLNLDDSVGLPVANRLSASGTSGVRALTLAGGTFNYTGSSFGPSSETLGATTFTRGAMNVITVTAGSGGSSNLVLGAPTRNVSATVLFRGSNLGSNFGAGVAMINSNTTGFTFTGAGAAGTVNKGIIPWAIIDSSATGSGTSFATADTATGFLRPLASTEYVTTLVTAGGANTVLSSTARLNASATVNSLTLNSGGGVTINPMQTLTVGGGANVGGILVQSGNTGISGGLLTNGATAAGNDLIFFANGNLTVGSTIVGTQVGSNPMLTKTGAGNLTLTSANPYIGQTVVQQGTLTLAGGNNTIFFSSANSFLYLGVGGTLDLNGNSQQVQGLFTDATVANGGGTVTGGAGSTIVTNSDTRNFAGTIIGSVAFQRGGSATATTMYSNNTYTGATLISGGTITLLDAGELSGTSSIGIDFGGVLSVNNQGTLNDNSRVNDAATITLRGGVVQYLGRAATQSRETFGTLSVNAGFNSVDVRAGGTGVNSADATFNTLDHTGLTGVVNFARTDGTNNNLGLIGSTPRVIFSTAPTVTNNLIGPWAIVSREFASYNSSFGVGALNQTGFAGYSLTTLAGSTATDNVKITNTATTLAANATAYTLNYAYNTTATGALALGGFTLNLAGGGLILGVATDTTNAVISGGTITAGTGGAADLYVNFLPYAGTARTAAINAVVADNGGALRLIITSSEGNGSANAVTLGGANTYTGGTVINGGQVILSATGVLQSGGITLNAGTLTQQTGGAINAGNTVTLNGNSTLTLTGTNTLAGLTFNTNGGANTAPTVAAGTQLNLTGGITANASNPNAVASITGTALDLQGATNFSMAINPITFNSQNVAPLTATLNITALIQNGGIVKTGGGLLQLGSATSNFTGGIDVQAGGLIFAAGSTGTPPTITAGPIGTGTLLVSGATTTLTADGTARTVGNAINFANTSTTVNLGVFGANTLTLSGAVTWSTGSGVVRTMNVNAVTAGGTTINAQTLSGTITSAGSGNGLIKDGIGTLAITGNNSTTLDLTGSQAIQINKGTLSINADAALGQTPGSAVSDNIVINGGVLAFSANNVTLNANRGISFGANSGAIDTGVNTTTIAGSLSGTGGVVKAGNGVLNVGGAVNTGELTVSAGTLNLTNAAAPQFTGLRVVAGSTFSLVNGVAQSVNMGSGALNLGAGSGTAALSVELGASGAADSLTTTATAQSANTVQLNLNAVSGMTSGTFTLLSAGGGLNSATYVINQINAAGFAYALSTSATQVQLTATAITGDLYWRGAVSNSWAGINNTTLATNFTTDLAGTTNAFGLPGVNNGVIFSANGVTGTTLMTTLDGAFSIRDLTFNNNVGSLTTIAINGGTGGSLRLTPTSSTAGINVQTGAPATINIGTAIILGANQTWSVADAATVLTASGGISGTFNLTKDGAGILALSGTNNYSGTTTVNGGVLRAAATNGFNQTSAVTIGSAGTLRLNGFSAVIGSLSSSSSTAIVDNNTATAATLTVGGDNSSTTFAGVLQNGSTGTLGLTKTGTGAFTLSGTSTNTGNLTVNTGTLNITGSLTGNNSSTNLIYGAAAGTSIVNVSGTIANYWTIQGATNASAVAVYNQTGGSATFNNTGTGNPTQAVASAGYGYMNITGGTLTVRGRFAPSNGAATTGVMYIGGTGTLDHSTGEWFLMSYSASGNGGPSMVTVGPGGSLLHAGATSPFGLNMDRNNGYAVLNVAGGLVTTSTQAVTFGNGAGTGITNTTGILNLAAGTLQIGVPILNANTAGSGSNAYMNFAGGTLRFSNNVTGALPATAAYQSFTATVFGAIDNSAATGNTSQNFVGGLTVDTNGFNGSLTQPIKDAVGSSGVAQSSLSITNAGSGYVGAPMVQFIGGTLASGGAPAAGYALINTTTGTVTGIVITSPGSYTTGPTSVTLTGGFGTGGTAATISIGSLVANTAAGLTKVGTGTLTLSGANTYTGVTAINAGTLALGANGTLANGSSINVNGGTLDMATFNNTVASVTLQSGTITGSTGVLTSTAAVDLQNGTVNFTGAGGIASTAGVNKTTAGTVALTTNGLGSYANAVNVNAGTLSFSTSAQLGSAAATNVINFNGGTLNFTPSGSVNLGATRSVTVNSGGGTVNVANPGGVLTISGGLSGTGDFTKSGPGQLSVTGTANIGATSTVNVTGGILQAGFGTGGVGQVNLSAGTLNMVNSAIEGLTLSNNVGALTIANGSGIGFEINGATNDSVTVGATGTAVASGTITINLFNFGAGIASGTYNLIAATGGGLTSGGADYVIGTAPSGFNYSLIETDTLIQLSVVNFSPAYWTNSQGGGSWSTLNTGNSNFSTDLAGTTNLGALPGSNETVIFSAQNATGPTISTTLDGAFTVYSLQFTSNPTGVTAVNIAPGTGGSLTIQPTTSAGGIDVGANAGNITISAPVTASNVGSPTQTWNINGTGANGSSLTISGNVTFNAQVVQTGAGVLTLSGTANTGTGGFSLQGGTLNVNADGALGTGAVTIGSGTVLNNNGASATVTLANTSYLWNGGFTFTGTKNLNLGTGTVTLGQSLTVTGSGSTLTVGGGITDGSNTFGLTKAGAGTLVLNGNNTHKGLTTVSAGVLTLNGSNTGMTGGVTLSTGTLNLGSATAIGTGTLTLNGGSFDNASGGALALTTNNAQTWSGTFSFTGSNNLNMGTGNITVGGATSLTLTASGKTLTAGGTTTLAANTLTLAGPGNMTFGGPISGTAGVLAMNSTGTLSLNGANTLKQLNIGGAASVIDIVSGSLAVNNGGGVTIQSTVNTTIRSSTSNGTVTLTVSDGDSGTANGTTLQIDAKVTGAFRWESFVANGNTGTTYFTNAANDFTGGLLISSGIIRTDVIGNTGSASPLGTGSTITIGGGTNTGATLRYTNLTGTGETTNKVIAMNASTGNLTLDMSGTGLLKLTSAFTAPTAGAKTLILTGSTAGSGEIAGAIPNNGGNSILKQGTGTWTLSGLNATAANNYAGATVIDAGTLAIVHASTANMTGGLTFGSAVGVTTAGTLDLSAGSATFGGGLIAQNNNVTGSTITIGSTNTLTITGAMTVGVTTAAAGQTTVLTVNGGNFVNNLGASAINIGQHNSGGTAATSAVFGTLDLSNAASVAINGTAGSSINIGTSNNTAAGTPVTNDITQGTLKLSLLGTNTVKATTITLGNSPNIGSAGIQGYIVLGNAANNFQADTIYVGRQKSVAGTSPATPGDKISFAGTGGTWTLGGLAGSKTALNIGYNDAANTGTTTTGFVDLTGGSFNGTLSTVNVGFFVSGTGGAKGTLTIAGGTTTADAIVLATVGTGTAGANITGTLNLNGGTLTLSSTGTGITNGASATVSGTATLTLNGGTLDLSGTNIGAGGLNTVVFNAQSGTLQNLNQFNNGAALNKTTTGTLVLSGTNAYTGQTNVQAGIVNIRSATALGATSAATVVTSGAALEIQGGITVGAEALTLNGTGVSNGGALRNVSGVNNYGGVVTLGAATRINSDAGTLNLTNTGTITGATNNLTLGGAGSGSIAGGITTTTGGLTVDGTGTWALTGTSNYTGATAVNTGKLAVGVSGVGSLGNTAVTVGTTGPSPTNGALQGSGTIGGSVTVNSGSSLKGGDANAAGALSIVGNTSLIGASNLNVDLVNTPTVNNSQIVLTGSSSSFSFGTGLVINLTGDGNDTGTPYTLLLVQTANNNPFAGPSPTGIMFNGANTDLNQVISKSDYTVTFTNFSSVGWSATSLMVVDLGGGVQGLQLAVATPEPHHILLICVSVLLVGYYYRRRLALRRASV